MIHEINKDNAGQRNKKITYRKQEVLKMRKTVSALILMILLVGVPAISMAGHGNGPGDGTGPIVSIYDGTPVTISGVVTAIGTQGQGMSIDTGTEVVTVYGIGPVRYWDAAGVARPQVGETVTVNGYEVTFSDGTTKIIATSIDVNGSVIQLRDDTDGTPLWRGGMGNGGRN